MSYGPEDNITNYQSTLTSEMKIPIHILLNSPLPSDGPALPWPEPHATAPTAPDLPPQALSANVQPCPWTLETGQYPRGLRSTSV